MGVLFLCDANFPPACDSGTRCACFKSDTNTICGKSRAFKRRRALEAQRAHTRLVRDVRSQVSAGRCADTSLSRTTHAAWLLVVLDNTLQRPPTESMRLVVLACLLALACSEAGSSATGGGGAPGAGNAGASNGAGANETNGASGAGAAAGGAGSGGQPTQVGGIAGASTGGDGGRGGSTLAGSGSGGSAGAATSTLPSCQLAFPYQDEPALGTWLGGDSAYSLVLDEHTALWSFQDTFVGKHGQSERAGSTLIANSYAYVSCDAGVAQIRYFWRHDGAGARAVMSDGVANQRFWPQQPFLYGGYLFQAMTRVQNGADEIGTTLARVKNPRATPDTWQVEYFDLAALSGLGKGTLIEGDYAYLFGNAGEAIITRLPLAELVKPSLMPSQLLQYLAQDDTWKQGLDTNDAKKLGFSANVGTSFRYLSQAKRWLVLFTNTSGWPAPNISISTSPALTGPWSKPSDVYRVPEMTPGKPEYDPDTVCYAAIEHAESNPAPETDLLFSYTCNSLVFEKQLANMTIYLPKIVQMKLPN
ncbi:MAG TPA: hypothetical protein VHB79_23240 [Polyangiaceae bacterium]|nr:hypothetical protein [Polyangiaceae bacterium]